MILIGQDKDQPEELEVIAGDEYVSVTDPILLSIIQHPARCVFCGHASCFDALVFFKIQSTFLQWKCPVCNIKIRGIQVSLPKKKKKIKWLNRSCRIFTLITKQN